MRDYGYFWLLLFFPFPWPALRSINLLKTVSCEYCSVVCLGMRWYGDCWPQWIRGMAMIKVLMGQNHTVLTNRWMGCIISLYKTRCIHGAWRYRNNSFFPFSESFRQIVWSRFRRSILIHIRPHLIITSIQSINSATIVSDPLSHRLPDKTRDRNLFWTHQIKAAAKFTLLIRLTSTSGRDKKYHTMPDAIATRIKSRSTFAGTGLSGMRTRPFPGARFWFGRIVERSEWESRLQLNLMMLASARRLWCLISGRVGCLMRRDKGSLMLNLGLPEAVDFLFLVVSLSYTLRLFGNGSISTGTTGSPSFVKSCEIEIHCATNWTLLLAPGRLMVSWGCRRGDWHCRREGINKEDEGELMHCRAL